MEEALRRIGALPMRVARTGARPALMLAAHCLREARDRIDRRLDHNLEWLRQANQEGLEGLELYATLRGAMRR